MKFYLGTHVPNWLNRTDVPLFISRRTLSTKKNISVAWGDWCLDSGGFSEIKLFGSWKTSKEQYLDEIIRYKYEIDNLNWVAPQDWMCEPFMLSKTGFSVYKHQILTLINFLWLRERVGNLVIPVLQGWNIDDYHQHRKLYEFSGIDLSKEETVGIGSVCRRQSTSEIKEIAYSLYESGISIHGFGVKSAGIKLYGKYLTSADSMAWSFNARYQKILLDGCVGHINCANCLKYALIWREKLLSEIAL